MKYSTVSSKDLLGVLNRREAKEFFKTLLDEQSIELENLVVISITDIGSSNTEEAILFGGNVETLLMQFHDLEEDFANLKTISNEEALEIAKFIEKNRNKKFLIHCEAGQSRSAGVALAVEAIKNHLGDKYSAAIDFSPLKAHQRYSPNRTVYDKILEQYEGLNIIKGIVEACPSCHSKFKKIIDSTGTVMGNPVIHCPKCYKVLRSI